MKYELALFDLDGTLIDSAESIIYCCQQSLDHFGYMYQESTDFTTMLGGHLANNFMEYFHVDPKEIREVVKYYRNIYASEGLFLAKTYVGIEDLLKELKKQGTKIGIATMKREDLARRMMEIYHLDSYFDSICGMDVEDTKTKESMIKECQELFLKSNKQTVMIGDTIGDKLAAQECSVDFISVTYGYGFSENATTGHQFVANQPKAILQFLR